MGEYQVIIDWALGIAQVISLELNHWLVNIKIVMKYFMGLTFNHVYRELNVEAYSLSKVALGEMDGKIHYSFFTDHSIVREGHMVLF